MSSMRLRAGRDADGQQQDLHAGAEVLVAAADGDPGPGIAADAEAADPGQDGRDDTAAEGEERGDGTGGIREDVAAAGPAGHAGEALSAEFPEVAGGLPDGAAVVLGQAAGLGGESGGGEPAGGRGQGERR